MSNRIHEHVLISHALHDPLVRHGGGWGCRRVIEHLGTAPVEGQELVVVQTPYAMAACRFHAVQRLQMAT